MPESKPGGQDRRKTAKQLLDIEKIKVTLADNKLLWLAPTVVFGVLGLAFALTKSDQWRASQALLVRDEAIGEMGFGPLGRFDSSDTLKRSLETILQIAKNKQVVAEALRQEFPDKAKHKLWPRQQDVESLQRDISVTAPKGTEFGATEVIYLSVARNSRQHAIAMTRAVCTQLEQRMQQLRDQHAQSIITELAHKKSLAESELENTTQELSQFERSLGSDLGEMRSLADTNVGLSSLASRVNEIKTELRRLESTFATQQDLLALLNRVGEDTAALVATPNQLLESQPALRRLKEGLVEAQLRTARLQGGMTADHPRVQAALLNEKNVRKQLNSEVAFAIRSTEADLAITQKKVSALNRKLEEIHTRRGALATKRGSYLNLVSEVSQCRDQLREARMALSEANGRQEAARAVSLITHLDKATTGSSPVGPSRAQIVLGSTLGGLLIGLSLVYLIAPWQENARRGRRLADQSGHSIGRRSSDQRQLDATDLLAVRDRRAGGGAAQNSSPEAGPSATTEAPLQVHSLQDAVAILPAESDKPDETSLAHLSGILKQD